MNKVVFSIKQRQFQTAYFRKYIYELRTNNNLIRGLKRLITFWVIILILKIFIESQIFHTVTLIVSALLFLFFFYIFVSVYLQWKGFGVDFLRRLYNQHPLYFYFDDAFYIYSNQQNIENENKSHWQNIKSIYFIKNSAFFDSTSKYSSLFIYFFIFSFSSSFFLFLV